ncbi:DUF3551 domain-containing protein [Bradyrhizobium sp. LB11.1]|uniref:DUF3551 domain-containing protein n=1 Tax=Bradyrhizobium sp. LB11.1 TaxID=3156326 RepID=UPI00339096B9
MRRSCGLIVTTGALLAAAPSYAQTYDPNYPVCMHVYAGGSDGGGEQRHDCSFTSLPQCRATPSGQAAICEHNPYYPVNMPPPGSRHKRSS